MADSKIEWTDEVWNPIRGCTRVSRGCERCYAERQAARNLPGMRSPTTGEPFATMTEYGPRWSGAVELIPEKLAEPLRWRKPRRVFVNSMSDLFHESLPFEQIAEVYHIMIGEAGAEAPPAHTYQVLTKRPERALAFYEWLRAYRGEAHIQALAELLEWNGPFARIWLGTSVEDQATADARIPYLLRCPAAVRFVSYEPALGPVDFTSIRFGGGEDWDALDAHGESLDKSQDAALDWLIVGGESGPGARPFDVEWGRSAIRQCRAAGVPIFVKQLGRWISAENFGEEWFAASWLFPSGTRFVPPVIGETSRGKPEGAVAFSLCDPKGGNMEEWPEDLRVREFPEVLRG